MGMFDIIFKKRVISTQRMCARRAKQLLFVVTGQDENGFSIEEKAYTKVITKLGGCLVFKRDVKVGGKLMLKEPGGISFLVEVRSYKYDVITNQRHIGFRVLKPAHRWFETVMASADQLSPQSPAQAYLDCNWLR